MNLIRVRDAAASLLAYALLAASIAVVSGIAAMTLPEVPPRLIPIASTEVQP